MFIHDSAAATSRIVTPEGFLRVRARIGRAGLHLYKASELDGQGGSDPNGTLRVYRPPDAVFDPDSMASFASKPVTDDHPPTMVDATNWKRYAVGHSGAEVIRDGDHLATDLLITDAAAVKRLETGSQLSNGYHADFDFTPGVTPDGEAYDALQSQIRGNHIALVDAGRCGDSCRIGDVDSSGCGCSGEATAPALVTVTIDGIAVQTTAAGAEALARLKLNLDAKDGALAALAAKTVDATALDALVAERATVIDAARATLGAGYDPRGATTIEIRRAVVARMLGASIDDRSDIYVAAAFDTLMHTARAQNPLAAHLSAAVGDGRSGREAARQSRDRFLNRAWTGETRNGDRE